MIWQRDWEFPRNLPWSPVGFDYKTSTGLGEPEIPVLEGTNKTLCSSRLRGKEQWLHRWPNQNDLLDLEGLLWRRGSEEGHHSDGSIGSSSLGRSPWGLMVTLLEVTINWTIESIDLRAGSSQVKKLPGREGNPTHQQITGLKLYWARPCPPEQDPVFPTTSPSHQEAYTSLFASSIKQKTEEARRTIILQQLK